MHLPSITARVALAFSLLAATGCGSLIRSLVRGADPAPQVTEPCPAPAPSAPDAGELGAP